MILKTLADIETKKERLNFLKQNKREILKAKKAMIKTTDSIALKYVATNLPTTKAAIELGDGEVMIVGNSVGFMDSHLDVSLSGSWTKTVQEKGSSVPILKDHVYTVDSMFAENLGAFVTELNITDLGYNKIGTTEVLAAKIRPEKEMYEKYTKGIIKQHSVGLQYVKLALAVNDEEDEEGYKEWVKNIDKVINREMAEEYGYFYPIYEQKLIEISAVVFGSNGYTPAFTDKTEQITQENEAVEDTSQDKESISDNSNFYTLINQRLWEQNQKR